MQRSHLALSSTSYEFVSRFGCRWHAMTRKNAPEADTVFSSPLTVYSNRGTHISSVGELFAIARSAACFAAPIGLTGFHAHRHNPNPRDSCSGRPWPCLNYRLICMRWRRCLEEQRH